MKRGLPKFLIPVLILIGVCVVGFLALNGLGRGLGGLLGGNTGSVPQTGGERLGPAFVASQIDRAGCPLDAPRTLDANQPFFAGIDESDIPAGTTVFARLIRDGIPVEDTDEMTAEEDLRTCVWFQFDPGRQGFEDGDYQVELIVNGQSAGRVPVALENGTGAGLDQPEIGRLYTSTRVDQGGCPVDDVSEFYADEDIYLATDPSRIPRGTEVFARLIYEGRPVEDTAVISAADDQNTCVWFVFEPGGQGFSPGRYQAELYVNGDRYDSIQFSVR